MAVIDLRIVVYLDLVPARIDQEDVETIRVSKLDDSAHVLFNIDEIVLESGL